MLNFLSPPTDSFYKFIGIGGLVLFITCGIFLFFGMYKDDYKLTLAKGKVEEQEARLITIVSDLEFLPQFENLDNVNIPKLRAWVNNLTNPIYLTDRDLTESFYALPDSI